MAEPGRPQSLATNRQVAAFDLYDIRWLLRPGENKIAVRLIPPETVTPLHWAPQFAIDGQGLGDGDDGWTFRTQAPDHSWSAAAPAPPGAQANVPNANLPQKSYRGCAIDPGAKLRAWLLLLAGVAFVMIGGSTWWHARHSDPGLTPVLLLPITVLASAVLLECAWAERHEALLFMDVHTWAWVLAAAAVAAGLAAAGQVLSRRGGLAAGSRFIRTLPETPAWRFLLLGLLLGCGFLRAYQIDFQPLDDDEYASTQAVLAIAEHGVPRYTDEVFYTRSPLPTPRCWRPAAWTTTSPCPCSTTSFTRRTASSSTATAARRPSAISASSRPRAPVTSGSGSS